jgi:hypothetical protein
MTVIYFHISFILVVEIVVTVIVSPPLTERRGRKIKSLILELAFKDSSLLTVNASSLFFILDY